MRAFRALWSIALAVSLAMSLLFAVADGASATPATFVQQGEKLTPSGSEASFGAGVALSQDGNTALIGGPQDTNHADPGNGAAWVFTRAGSAWTQQGPKLNVTEAGNEEGQFGRSVALSADGNTALIAGHTEYTRVGAAWVFTRSRSTWTRAFQLTNGEGKESFGGEIALAPDGNTALIGDGEAVWPYTRSGTSWIQGSKITPSDATAGSGFGSSIALSTDGNGALISDPGDNGGVGAAWTFTRSGSTWTQQGSKLTAADESGDANFGSSVALASDGDVALIGGSNDNSGDGAAWLFTRAGATLTQHGSKLTARDEIGKAGFGSSVALSSNGRLAVVGGPGDNPDAGMFPLGAAWVFKLSSSSHSRARWAKNGEKLTGGGETPFGGAFGASVALSSDSTTALIGGPLDSVFEGSAWVFVREGHRGKGNGVS